MNERFDDEVISAVLDGDADDETTAAVMADPAARRRLDALRSVQSMVASPPPPAEPERRAASIAAALAEAKTAPEVTSLAAARSAPRRRWRPRVEWVAAAAAILVAVLAVPLLGNLTGSDDADTAIDTAIETAEVADAGGDRALSTQDDAEMLPADSADSDDAGDAMVEEAASAPSTTAASATLAPEEATADDAMDDSADEAADAADAEADFAREPTVVNSNTVLQQFLGAGIIRPEYFATDPEIVEAVNPVCLEPFAGDDGEVFSLVLLTPTDGVDRFVLVHFADDGTTTTLDAEDCTPVG